MGGRGAPSLAASEVLWFLRSIYCTRTLAAVIDPAYLHGQRVPADARDLQLGPFGRCRAPRVQCGGGWAIGGGGERRWPGAGRCGGALGGAAPSIALLSLI